MSSDRRLAGKKPTTGKSRISKNYIYIGLKRPIVETIAVIVEAHPELRYRSVAHFVEFAVLNSPDYTRFNQVQEEKPFHKTKAEIVKDTVFEKSADAD